MPSLIAFNRRWRVGSDDFVYPGLGEIFLRLIWLVVVAVVYTKQKKHFVCSHGYLLHSYCIGILVVLTLHILLDVVMVTISSRGTVLDVHPRRHLHIVLYCKLTMLFPELVFTILGTIWAFDLESNCEASVVLAMRLMSIAGWMVLLFILVGLVVIFDPVGGSKLRHDNMLRMQKQRKLWKQRCRYICCCANQDENSASAFDDIAQLITDFFKDMDVVATDIAAGLLLLQMENKTKPKRILVEPITSEAALRGSSRHASLESQLPITNIKDDLDFPRPQSWMTISEAAHYMKFAEGSYGWALFMYSNIPRCCGVCRLCTACRCCDCLRSSGNIVEDNSCGCNTASIIKTAAISRDDIIYASYFNRIYQSPFYVALDHKEEAVVVAIRGTLSLRDAITDLTAASEEIEAPNVQGGYAHKGILQTAKYILNTLNNLHILENAFIRAPGYQLIITGHSLGAGVASILAILLRSEFPQLKCFAFSPPGWLVSLSLARYTEDFICSVVLGNDLVPRLGLINMENLKTNIISSIHHCDKPKYQILAGGTWHMLRELCSTRSDGQLSQSTTSSDDSSQNLNPRASLARSGRALSYTEELHNHGLEASILDESGRSTMNIGTALYMPGHILYLQEHHPNSGCCAEPVYQAAWARAETFDEIIVSSNMIRHHLPDVVSDALNKLSSSSSQPTHIAYISRNHTSGVI